MEEITPLQLTTMEELRVPNITIQPHQHQINNNRDLINTNSNSNNSSTMETKTKKMKNNNCHLSRSKKLLIHIMPSNMKRGHQEKLIIVPFA